VKKNIGKIAFVLALAFVLLLSANAEGGHAAAASDNQTAGALTPPPPNEFSVESVFDPSQKYLLDGDVGITAETGKVSVFGQTTATQNVDSIGVTYYVQKWNGSSWEDYGSGFTTGTNNTSIYTGTFLKSTTPGYYFRARTIHWVTENGVYEQGELYSGYVLSK
jgi:hypothetical protein